MSPNTWGPFVWKLFHVLVCNIKDSEYNKLKGEIFSQIKNICTALPCPDCSTHATQFLSKITPHNYDTKEKMINLFYNFHNIVNKKKNKPIYEYKDLDKYKDYKLLNVVNEFAPVYTNSTKGNLKLLTQNFQRKNILSNFRAWILTNLNNFDNIL